MKTKKFFCILLCFCLLFSLACCGKENKKGDENKNFNEAVKTSKTLNLLYCRSDSFNPYTAVSEINRNLCKLIYEPLIKVDNEYKPVLRLAKSADLEGKVCKIELISAAFSDGSAVTSDDVIYSYNKAVSSSTIYASRLYEVVSVSKSGSNTVVFNLNKSDPYFLNLIDFPIIKKDSDNIVSSDGVAAPPIGSGRYVFDEKSQTLKLNDKFYGKKGEIAEITLIDAPDGDSVSHYVEIGATDIYYTDLSDNSIVRMSGKKTDVNLNNLVYIGINSANGALSNKYMRYAISSAIDRAEISSNAYYNNATPASGFVNPVFSEVSSMQSLKPNADLEITVANLDKIGYNKLDIDGKPQSGSGKTLKFNLLVNRENSSRLRAAELIKKQLAAAGIEIAVIAKSYQEYAAALSSGAFELYLGEVNILPNMDFSQLVLSGGSAAFGVGNETPTVNEDGTQNPTSAEICASVISTFYEGKSSLSDVAGTLLTEMPQIPVCYRKGNLFYSNNIKEGVLASFSDIYFSFESYTKK